MKLKLPRVLIVIFVFALFIRLFQLDTFPLGFHVDEAKVAWEAYSILKTGRDDHGNLLALHYNSFGDYRPTGIFYAAIPSLIIFGRSNFAVRFPSALFGALTVIPIYYIAYGVTKNKRTAILSAFLLSIIPWDIATSRATSEVVISAFLILSSLALLKKKPVWAFSLLALSFLFYHSARVMGPILIFVYLTKNVKNLKNFKKIVLGFLITSFLALILLLSPAGRARYDQVKIPDFGIRSLFINYTSYFDPNFFIGNIAKPFRYVTGNVGIVSIPIFILFLLGIYIILKTNKNKILLLFLALGPIPAALTLEDSPNLHRAFFMLPFLVIIAAIGLNFLMENHRTFYKIIVFCMISSFLSFAFNYLSIQNNFAYEFRDPQTKKLSLYLASVQNNYTKIYVTNDPDSPYPWYGFFNNIDPYQMNKALQKQVDGRWNFENIIWDNNRCPKAKAFEEADKQKLDKIMVIENGMCTTDLIKGHTEAKIIQEFTYNGKVNYRVWEYEPSL